MCACYDAYACGRVAYGHSRGDCICHTHSHFYGDANQCPCTDGVGHTDAIADHHPNTDTGPDRHPNTDTDADCHLHTDTHSNRRTDSDAHTHPNANTHSRARPNTGRRPRHRLLPCQRGRG